MKRSGRKDDAERRKDIYFTLYLLLVLLLAWVYFSVPERPEFIQYQLKWWQEMWQVFQGG